MLEVTRADEPMLEAGAMRETPQVLHIREILVPTDFSDCARKALQYAVPLARQHHAVITLLNVTAPMPYPGGEYVGPDYMAVDAELRASSEKKLDQLAATEIPAEVEARCMARSGSAADAIVDLAQSLPADLIVISTHGRSGLKHVLLGSVAEHVVRRAPCPVLVVREHEREIVDMKAEEV
jgi:nucleotide-binding universal stress UspA family protein